MAYGFTIATLREALTEPVFMGYADRPRDGVLGVEDQARVNAAIAEGCSEADSYIAKNLKYTVPLGDEEVTPIMRRHVRSLIVFALCEKGRSVPEDVQADYDRAVQWCKDVGCGKAQLGVTASEPALYRVPITTSGPPRKFTRKNLRELL